jgi:hypothetical protein
VPCLQTKLRRLQRRHLPCNFFVRGLQGGMLAALSLFVGGLLITYVDTPIARRSKKSVVRWLDDRAAI